MVPPEKSKGALPYDARNVLAVGRSAHARRSNESPVPVRSARAWEFVRRGRLLDGDVARAVEGGRTVGTASALARAAAGRTHEFSGAAYRCPLVGAGHQLAILRDTRVGERVTDLVAVGERLDEDAVALRVVAGSIGELGDDPVLLLDATDRAAF